VTGRQQLIAVVAAVVTVLIVVVVVLTAVDGGGGSGDDPGLVADYPYDIQTFADLGREHFAAGEAYNEYNGNPPTTGPHASVYAQWGIYEEPQPKEQMVHNMEHAGVIVWHNCGGGDEPLSVDECAQLKNDLASIVQPAVADGEMIVMTPYADMQDRIALTAWRHLDSFNDFDEQRVRTFLETFECRYDPENIC
jgi:hypothetical protein